MKTSQALTALTLLILILPLAVATTISGQGSSYTFNITNCNANPNSTLNCTSATIRYECTITDPAFINQVSFRIQGNDYTTTQNTTTPSQFYYFYNKPQDYTSTTTPVELTREQITDTNNVVVNAYELVSIPRNCSICDATYNTTTLTTCQTNNTYIQQHISSNETCAPSYNSTEYCNYCDPDIILNTTTCTINEQTNQSYYDQNYTTCCLTTGLEEDCLINQNPYNTTTQVTCVYLTQDFNCTLDPYPILTKKINLACTLPTESECVVNTYLQQTETEYLLSISPEYKKSSGSLLSLAQESEERNTFTTTNKLLNAYYTNKGLKTEVPYKIQILCSDNTTTTKYETIIRPKYETPDWIIHRSLWAKEHIGWILVTTIILTIVVILIIFYAKSVKNIGR